MQLILAQTDIGGPLERIVRYLYTVVRALAAPRYELTRLTKMELGEDD